VEPHQKLVAWASLIVGSMAAGYAARKLRWLGESTSRVLMTVVMALGYSSVQLLAIWKTELSADLVLLPILGAISAAMMLLLGLFCARLLTGDRAEMGIFSIASGAANTGVTMGGLVLLALYGQRGLALMSIYCIMWMPLIVIMMYPIARHFSPDHTSGSLGRLMLRSIFDWRSLGLPMALLGLALNLLNQHQPEVISSIHLAEIFAVLTTSAAYFSIGLTLRLRGALAMLRLILGLAVTRFVLSGLVAAGLVWATARLGFHVSWELRNTVIIEAMMPAAVATAAIASMFNLRPDRASTLFVVNTLMFIAMVMPVVFWLFSR